VATVGGNPRAQTRIMLRPIGTPLPLGLLAVMTAGTLLSLQQLEAFPVTQGRTIAFVLLGFAVPLMVIAAVFAFLARDTIAGTALGLFAGTWLATALTTLNSPPGSTSDALGAFYVCLSLALLVVIAGASLGKLGLALVVIAGATRFLVAGIYELTGDVGVEHAAGVLGFALVATALYAALATEIEDVRGEPKLPLGRRAKARDAIEGPFERQLEGLEHEAGVRQQL
jgi:uncharacterized protein